LIITRVPTKSEDSIEAMLILLAKGQCRLCCSDGNVERRYDAVADWEDAKNLKISAVKNPGIIITMEMYDRYRQRHVTQSVSSPLFLTRYG
jgi:hypothetical protein